MKKRLIRWVILLIIGVSIGAIIGYFQSEEEIKQSAIAVSPDDAQTNATILRKSKSTATKGTSDIGGDFALVNQDGQNVTQDTYKDAYKIIFFGFTYCPAICPTELQKVAQVLNQLGADADKITPLFITVDPERDTVPAMKQYVEQFHPKLVGLTGSQAQIDTVKKAYRVFATKVENEMMDEYMMDHSAFLYLMSPDNKMIALYPSTDTAQSIAADIKARNL